MQQSCAQPARLFWLCAHTRTRAAPRTAATGALHRAPHARHGPCGLPGGPHLFADGGAARWCACVRLCVRGCFARVRGRCGRCLRAKQLLPPPPLPPGSGQWTLRLPRENTSKREENASNNRPACRSAAGPRARCWRCCSSGTRARRATCLWRTSSARLRRCGWHIACIYIHGHSVIATKYYDLLVAGYVFVEDKLSTLEKVRLASVGWHATPDCYDAGATTLLVIHSMLASPPPPSSLTWSAHGHAGTAAPPRQVAKDPSLERWQLFLVSWGYNTPEERERAARNPRIQVIGAQQFAELLKP